MLQRRHAEQPHLDTGGERSVPAEKAAPQEAAEKTGCPVKKTTLNHREVFMLRFGDLPNLPAGSQNQPIHLLGGDRRGRNQTFWNFLLDCWGFFAASCLSAPPSPLPAPRLLGARPAGSLRVACLRCPMLSGGFGD